GFNTNEAVQLGDFAIDRYEVTNDAFKKFVDAGGYSKADNWNGAPVAQFVDSTGRPGPSAWELGGFPSGQADFPVGGVSWYEADAYCRAQGKTLPSVYHWARAALSPVEIASPLAPTIIPVSNFSKKACRASVNTTAWVPTARSTWAATCASGCGMKRNAAAAGSSADGGTTRRG